MIEEDDEPTFDPSKYVYEVYTEHIAAKVEVIMAYLNEVDVVNERKIVEFDLDSTQGKAKVTIQWTPQPGKTPGDLLG